MEPETIDTERLRLTPLSPEDADAMFPVLDDERMHEFTGGRPLSLDDLRARYRRLAVGLSSDGSEHWLNWIVRTVDAGEAVGVIQATVDADGTTADVAWEVGVAFQRRGLATEAATAVVRWLVGRGVTTIGAAIHPDHAASARVAERAGLRPTAERVDGEVLWHWSPG